jgi:hypothetical protein
MRARRDQATWRNRHAVVFRLERGDDRGRRSSSRSSVPLARDGVTPSITARRTFAGTPARRNVSRSTRLVVQPRGGTRVDGRCGAAWLLPVGPAARRSATGGQAARYRLPASTSPSRRPRGRGGPLGAHAAPPGDRRRGVRHPGPSGPRPRPGARQGPRRGHPITRVLDVEARDGARFPRRCGRVIRAQTMVPTACTMGAPNSYVPIAGEVPACGVTHQLIPYMII